MRRFLFNIALFFFLVGAVDLISGQIFSTLLIHAKGGEAKQFHELFEKDKHEILIMGSSRAHHHYVPSIFEDSLGYDCYNAGYDGNGVILAYPLLENMLNRYKPRLVIFEVSKGFDIMLNADDNENTRYLSKLKPYAANKFVSEVINSVSKEEEWCVKSSLYQYNTLCVSLLIDNLVYRQMQADGYAPLKGVIKKKQGMKPDNLMMADPLKINYLTSFAELAKKHNVQMVWVLSPQLYSQKDSRDFAIAKQIASDKGLLFLDFYNHDNFVNHLELFQDPTHLNDEGARLFSKMIASLIKDKMATD